jgi:hypothetical protein
VPEGWPPPTSRPAIRKGMTGFKEALLLERYHADGILPSVRATSRKLVPSLFRRRALSAKPLPLRWALLAL